MVLGRRVGGGAGRDDEVESALQDGGVGDGVDDGEREVGQGLLEAPEDAVREEEEVACVYYVRNRMTGVLLLERHTVFVPFKTLDVICLLAFPPRRCNRAHEFLLVRLLRCAFGTC